MEKTKTGESNSELADRFLLELSDWAEIIRKAPSKIKVTWKAHRLAGSNIVGGNEPLLTRISSGEFRMQILVEGIGEEGGNSIPKGRLQIVDNEKEPQ